MPYRDGTYDIQVALLDAGFDLPIYGADGIMGDETREAIRLYQAANGLQVDGIVGPNTMGSLQENHPVAFGLEPVVAEETVEPETVGLDDDTDGETTDGEAGGTVGLDDDTDGETTDSEAGGTVGGDTVVETNDDLGLNSFITGLGMVGIDSATATNLWNEMQTLWQDDANYTIDDALIDMYDTDAFRERFEGIADLRDARDLADTDQTAFDIPTVTEYLALEAAVTSGLSNLGQTNAVAGQFASVVSDLVANGVDATEVQERFDAAGRIIGESVPDEIRNIYAEWYGNQGEGNLIMTFLDPEDSSGAAISWDELEAGVDVAETAGWAAIHGDLQLAQSQAERITQLGQTQYQLWESFSTIRDQEALFSEKLGEEDFTAEEEGVEGALFGGTEVEKRRQSRVAEFSGGGGAFISGEGTGLGSA